MQALQLLAPCGPVARTCAAPVAALASLLLRLADIALGSEPQPPPPSDDATAPPAAPLRALAVWEERIFELEAEGAAPAGPETAEDVTIETEHPYPNNCDWTREVGVPGAIAYELVFDPRCRTEHGQLDEQGSGETHAPLAARARSHRMVFRCARDDAGRVRLAADQAQSYRRAPHSPLPRDGLATHAPTHRGRPARLYLP